MHNTALPPWLADDAQLELSFKKGKQPLSHRRWPGDPVPPIEEGRLQRLANDIPSRYQHIQALTWDYETCTAEWRQAIAQAVGYVGEAKPAMPPRALAALTRLAEDDSPELLDEIVQLRGVEYATEVVIERQFITVTHSNLQPPSIVFSHPKKAYQYGFRCDTYHEFDLRLRKHLSLAEEAIWLRCADKLIRALPDIELNRKPFIALLLPERPDVANSLLDADKYASRSSSEWLKAVATDPAKLAVLEQSCWLDVFTDCQASEMCDENRYGYSACAALLREQGLAAIPRLAIYAHRNDCGSLLAQINHPQAIRLLLLVADKNKPSQQRVSTFAKKYPHAALAAVAELLALPEPPARPGYPEIAEKKRPQQQKKREESWRMLLRTLLNTHPQLAEQVTPWLSTKAQELLAASRPSMPSDVTLATDRSCLPEILRSPPWRSKKKKVAPPRFALTSLTVAPQEHWQPGEREALAASKPACFFNKLPLDERLASIGCTIVMQELGFQSIEYLFHQYTLCGKRDHFDTEKYFHRYVWWGNACHALQNFDIATLLEAWGDYLVKAYNPNDCWNLYLLMQLPRERALVAWQGINAANFRFVGAEYALSILGTDALPGLLLALQHRPKEIFPLLTHLGATELALPMARVWRRLQAHSQLARQWLLQWPEHAAAALIPLAFDKAGDSREAAINALRLLYQEGHHERLKAVAQRWNEPALWTKLEQLLTQDPLDNYPVRIPKVPDFWQPTLWRRPRLIGTDQPLTDDALEIFGEMLRFAQGGHHYGGLDLAKAACQPQSLAAFVWDLFNAWQTAGAPAKDNWAFQALGIFGDEATVRDLTQLILAWPQEGKSARAASGLHLLTRIGSDMALLQLHHIAQGAKSRPLRESARQSLKEVAEARDLSEEQLQDRLTPTLGLDDPQTLAFDFGSRGFYVRFDENLLPVIYDQQGARQKSLPRLRAEDDQVKAAEALARLKGLKKDAAQVAKRLLPHLENALRLARRWTRTEFQSLFVDHPLTNNLTRRLVWGIYAASEPRRLLNAFRVAAEEEFCDGQDDPIALPEEALFGLAHPLEMDDATRAAFSQIFADYQLLPPFRQLTRQTVQLLAEETARSELTRWQGKSTTCGQLLGIRSRGWWQGAENRFCYDVGRHRLILEITPGFVHYNMDAKAPQRFATIRLYDGERPAAFSQLDPQDLSEALSTIEIIFRG
ncbi:DUF4132 domain-containing protein [Klebsiella grimontii]|uniref:DUF4132 domain-containing protein n=1 Tax=Klebsiella grimontii TaxID=2058152 RepID=UPI001CCB286E|nr:DUF4132 domain-containing protein [Klebsiella grimontii]MBZ7514042.1 DUF4132 domain-containing protein [Klebsiella grimontii]MDD9673550.1 DUF4132 domain-containing protein [Klebsiella grimontii]MDD9680023.1 DUF4132 domain-containing protein [Klebsiella grimontii]MDD9689997.1 DUF4132 domain-containing protein [Klebsiella grimontii]MDD9700066.1 DUF4132 domain-containing protein [Klebsiella grimontii]